MPCHWLPQLFCLMLLLFNCLLPLNGNAQTTPDDRARTNTNPLPHMPLQPRRRPHTATDLNFPTGAIGRPNPLVQAIGQAFMSNNTNEAAHLLRQYTGDVNDLRAFGRDPLIVHVARQGNVGMLDLLLERKADPNLTDAAGNTALFAAIQRTAWPIALRLIAAGADVSKVNTNSPTPGSPLGELVNMWWNGRPDHELQTQLLEQLLEHGADPFASANRSYSPFNQGRPNSVLESAMMRNDWALTDLLLTNRPSPARRTPAGDTALHLAVQWERTNVVDFLLSAGFSINQTNNDGLTPLQCVVGSSSGSGSGFPGQTFGFSNSGLLQKQAVRMFSTRGVLGVPPQPSIADFLLSRGATLDAWSAAGLGKTNELAALLRVDPALANARDGLGRTPLHYATIASEIDAAKLLIQAGADLSAQTTKPIFDHSSRPMYRSTPSLPAGTTPLHLASMFGNADLIGLFLHSGAAVGQPNGDGETALHLAARQWQTNALQLLIAAHAPLDATNHAGHTALWAAVESSVWQNVESLLRAGAQAKTASQSETLLHVAAQRGSPGGNVIDVLLRHGLKLEARDAKGRTPFMLAAEAKQWDSMNLLLTKGSDINAVDTNGDTALHLLSRENMDTASHQVELSWLARHEADWLMQSGFRHNTITNLVHWKIISQPTGPVWTNTSVTTWLLEHHARPDLTNHVGQTPLCLLCAQEWLSWQQSDATNRVASLLNAGARVDVSDKDGITPLQAAIAHAPIEVVSLLIKRTGRIDQPVGDSGQTLLHMAVTNHQFESTKTVSFLLDNHANPNVRDKLGRTPLHVFIQAAQSGDYQVHVEAAEALLKGGADLSLRDNEGQTFLHEWCKQGRSHWSNLDDMVRQLLARHPELANVTNADGDTPLHTAVRSGNQTAAQILLQNGADQLIRNARGETALYLAQKDNGGYLANVVHPKGASYNFYFSMATRNQAEFELFLKADPKLATITFNNGQTALVAATKGGRKPKEFAERLLELGAKLDPVSALWLGRMEDARRLISGSTNLPGSLWFEAIMLKRFDDIRDLAASRGDLQVLDEEGHTLLYHATTGGQTNTADWLRDRGVKPNFFDAVGLGDTNTIVAFLSTNQSLANATYAHDQTMLMFAASARQRDSARVLIEHGAKIDAENPQGWTALHVACACGAVEVADELVRAGGRIDARESDGLAPLHLAAAGGSNAVVRLLLDHGANVNLPQTEPANFRQNLSAGSTPLHWAALCNRLETVKLLLQSGADVNATNAAGESPLDLVGINPSTYQGIPGPLRRGYYSMANRGPKQWTQIETELKKAGGIRKCTVAISTGYERVRGN